MRKSVRNALLGAAVITAMVVIPAGTAAGEEHDHEVPLHPHALVVGIGGDEDSGFTAVNCIDLAANRAVPLQAHHHHIHTGAAGAALADNTANFAIPLAPLSPWADCDELFEAFDVTIVRGNK